MTPTDKSEELIQLAHPLGIACRQIVVHRHHMHALSGQRIQIGRQGRHQGLAFAGAHLGDLAVMQHHAADQLHIEVPHLQGALAAFAHHGKSFRQDRIQRFALLYALLEFCSLAPQGIVGKSGYLLLQRIDTHDVLAILFEQAVVTTAKYGFQQFGDHAVFFLLPLQTKKGEAHTSPFD